MVSIFFYRRTLFILLFLGDGVFYFCSQGKDGNFLKMKLQKDEKALGPELKTGIFQRRDETERQILDQEHTRDKTRKKT